MKLIQLVSGIECSLCGTLSPDTEIVSITTDSHSVEKGSLFICIKGTRTDGHKFASDAVAAGAAAVVVENIAAVPEDIPFVSVADTRVASAFIWNNFYNNPAASMKLFAVTGTCGKTSTAFILRSILAAAGYRVGLIGTVKCLIGDEEIFTGGGSELFGFASAMTTPDCKYLYGTLALMKKSGVNAVVMEASSHALSQSRLDALFFNYSIFTNLTPEHMDYHTDMEDYYRAKRKLFMQSGCGIVNIDSPYGQRLIKDCPSCRMIRCSSVPENAADGSCDVSAVLRHSYGVDGIEYIYYSEEAIFRIRSRIPGNFTFENTLLAAAAAIALGIPRDVVRDGIKELRGIDGRVERVKVYKSAAAPGKKDFFGRGESDGPKCAEYFGEADCGFSVFIDYAHTTSALEKLLVSFRELRSKSQRIVLLFGCGGDRDKTKRAEMGRCASRLADFIIITSDNSRSEEPQDIIADILAGVASDIPKAVIVSRREAIRYAVKNAAAGDIIILAGKGHEKYEIDKTGKHPFDEAQIVRDAVAEFHRDKV